MEDYSKHWTSYFSIIETFTFPVVVLIAANRVVAVVLTVVVFIVVAVVAAVAVVVVVAAVVVFIVVAVVATVCVFIVVLQFCHFQRELL